MIPDEKRSIERLEYWLEISVDLEEELTENGVGHADKGSVIT